VKEKARVAILAVTLAVLFMAALPPRTAKADSSPDYAVPLGHFYTQANGYTAGTSPAGFSITDEDGVYFWTAYQNLGGPDLLGYPISRRYTWAGYVCQATERAVLQWHPDGQRVELVNIMDQISTMGKNGWLKQAYSVPDPRVSKAEADQTFEQIKEARLKLLEANEALRARYYAPPDPLTTFGLPASTVTDFGSFYAIRTQRSAIFQCRKKLSWCNEGDVTVLAAGLVAREAGLIPADATTPEEPERRYVASSRWEGRDITGVATWYGWSFHGRLMRNGEPFNMWDSTIAACNVFPLETLLRVTNLDTGESIIVRVTDTGGFGWPVVIDLSYAAFSQLASPADGTIQISIQAVEVGN